MQLLVNICLTAGLYTIVATGFYVILDTYGIINLAHGELILVGAYLSWLLNDQFNVEPLIALVFVLPIMVILGYVLYYLYLYLDIYRHPVVSLLISFAAAILLRNGFRLVFSPNPRSVQTFLVSPRYVGNMVFPAMRTVLAVLALLLIVGLTVWYRYARLGKSLRCVSQNVRAARMIGLNVQGIQGFALAFSMALAGVAGVLISPIYILTPDLGQFLTIKAVAVVMLAYKWGLPGVLLASLFVAALETSVATYVRGTGTSLSEIVALLVILFSSLFQWRLLKNMYHAENTVQA
ncbi:MAG: branched-chain amino acid ABC transporter permease [Chloroflexi bacterium]|nr:branched-chain amino acid ABC transporter permease [Chloroflexota bacterium]